ncbi:S66 peptidase family protein [Solitalea canadensis]|uniref:Putative MccF-like protein (Microcin C7 resistance) n=1 Tax=Solitalea canadensis (strain ATCC 29591 / DSM 3403 / JCM 21819 / LMG 8368 / NBRC 15130 / NCIMB 12057 / USAM 9D) TaxID=929556 RepID=H8KLX4_SOLCM|nr:LD-carboxypeptidase [Solitalea canadensis]AFD08702.1 putative MccF-like protein (microcin C7 resistance) [Solitalea canadensis DSM 3403]
MNKIPPYLQAGDTIGILCTARYVDIEQLQPAIKLFESWGLKVKLGSTIGVEWNIFGGDDTLRAQNLTDFFNDPDVKAIVCARGGYGTVRMIDSVDFSGLLANPKWLVGFSDVTILHSHINSMYEIPTLHASMPVIIDNKTPEAIDSLKKALFGDELAYTFNNSSPYNRYGEIEGEIVGGNLSLIHTIQNTVSELYMYDKILFIEEVGEWMYNLDRMMWNLKRSGKLQNIRGLIVGSFTELQDNEIPFGLSYEEIIWEKVKDYDFPVCFNFPAGHIADNRAIKLGHKATLRIGDTISFWQE